MDMKMASRWLGWACLGSCTLACSAQKVVTTWWPDPGNGIMWTGYEVSGNSAFVTYQKAYDICQNLTLGGFTGWRLPTIREITPELASINYDVTEVDGHIPHGGKITSTHQVSGEELRFNHFSSFPIWTADSAGDDRMYARQWSGTRLVPVVKKGNHTDNGPIGAFCVRNMEPDLRSLAEQAQAPSPVSSLSQLQSIVVLVQAEKSMASDQFQQSLDLLKKAFALDPKSARGYDDMGMSEAYLGNWADAITSLNTAHVLSKGDQQISAGLKWAKDNQKQAGRDPKTTQGRVLVHDAEVALHQNRYEDALTVANQVIALEPQWPQGYDRQGDALSGLKRLQDAESAFQKAVALDKHGETNAKAELKAVKAAIKAGTAL